VTSKWSFIRQRNKLRRHIEVYWPFAQYRFFLGVEYKVTE